MPLYDYGRPPVAPEGAGYRCGRWGDYVQYACLSCAFDALDEPGIREHVYHAHVKPTLKAPGVLLYDADGNPIYAPKTIDDDSEE